MYGLLLYIELFSIKTYGNEKRDTAGIMQTWWRRKIFCSISVWVDVLKDEIALAFQGVSDIIKMKRSYGTSR